MKKTKVFFVSLGCDKNRVDSEEMLGHLAASGFSFTNDETEADVIVVNTCCFIDEAKEESIEAILEMAQMKAEGNCRKLVVAGCLAERYREEIRTELPEVDMVCGVNELPKIIEACMLEDESDTESVEDKKDAAVDSGHETAGNTDPAAPKRILTTSGHFEFLKIAEGCNKRCTYCVIPYIRGSYRSYTMDSLLEEAQYLAEQGVKELIIVAQETSIYGRDLYGEDKLPELLRKLCLIDGIRWIRVLYCYPEDITEDFLHVMAQEEKIVNYIDMPIQHASDKILKRMGRRTSHDSIVQTIKKAREIVDGVVLRTSLISGFPGETEEDHKILVDFVKEMRFDHLGVFIYSREEGTPAHDFADQVDEAVKIDRRNEIMQIQEQISEEKLFEKKGQSFDIIVEGKLPEDDAYVGRTWMDAPDVDGLFYFQCDEELMTGDMVRAVATESGQYDLFGEYLERI